MHEFARSRPRARGQRRLRLASRAFSAVEIMNFLGLAAALGAVAMYGLARYVRHSKTAEAVASVTQMAAGAAEFYNTSDANQPQGASPEAVHAMRRFPPSSRVPVPEDPMNVRGKRYQSNMVEWAASPWRELHFSIVQPQSYQYSFESESAGATAKATVKAEGDLDGDGHRSSYTLGIMPDEKLSAQPAREVTKTDPEE